MCNSPITQDGVTFACRVCDQCVKAKLQDWTVRGVAEASTSGQAFGLDMTYRNNPDGTLPDGACAFNYEHVKLFMKSLREAYFRKYEARGEIRFLICGERGTRLNRVHWHLILFAKRDMTCLGEWTDFYGRELKGPRYKRMDHWSFWPHGHLVYKPATQATIGYAIKYAMSDRFNLVQAEGTSRYSKALVSASSYFRMSKHPPIGAQFLENLCNSWEERLITPPDLNIKVPGYNGYWYVKGDMRQYLCERLHDINKKRIEQTGTQSPTWRALLASVETSVKDWEDLYFGSQAETKIKLAELETEWWEERGRDQFARYLAGKPAHQSCEQDYEPDFNIPELYLNKSFRRTCFSLSPCQACQQALTPKGFDRLARFIRNNWPEGATFEEASEAFTDKISPNPFCQWFNRPDFHALS
jgi:hypothetical protein